MKRDRIGAGAPLRNKSDDAQRETGKNKQRPDNPAEWSVNKTGRREFIRQKSCEQRNQEEQRLRDDNARPVFSLSRFNCHWRTVFAQISIVNETEKRRAPSFPKAPFILRWR